MTQEESKLIIEATHRCAEKNRRGGRRAEEIIAQAREGRAHTIDMGPIRFMSDDDEGDDGLK
jgi:hypothetical protein